MTCTVYSICMCSSHYCFRGLLWLVVCSWCVACVALIDDSCSFVGVFIFTPYTDPILQQRIPYWSCCYCFKLVVTEKCLSSFPPALIGTRWDDPPSSSSFFFSVCHLPATFPSLPPALSITVSSVAGRCFTAAPVFVRTCVSSATKSASLVTNGHIVGQLLDRQLWKGPHPSGRFNLLYC